MKTLIRNIRTIAAFAAVLAIPHPASAATKTWTVLAAAPATTNITAGVATNLTTTLTWTSGSGSSARFAGPAFLDISLSPAEPTITIALSQTNFTFPSANTTFNPTLTFATTALTPSNTYVVTIIGNTNPPTPPNPNVIPVTNYFTVDDGHGCPVQPRQGLDQRRRQWELVHGGKLVPQRRSRFVQRRAVLRPGRWWAPSERLITPWMAPSTSDR